MRISFFLGLFLVNILACESVVFRQKVSSNIQTQSQTGVSNFEDTLLDLNKKVKRRVLKYDDDDEYEDFADHDDDGYQLPRPYRPPYGDREVTGFGTGYNDAAEFEGANSGPTRNGQKAREADSYRPKGHRTMHRGKGAFSGGRPGGRRVKHRDRRRERPSRKSLARSRNRTRVSGGTHNLEHVT